VPLWHLNHKCNDSYQSTQDDSAFTHQLLTPLLGLPVWPRDIFTYSNVIAFYVPLYIVHRVSCWLLKVYKDIVQRLLFTHQNPVSSLLSNHIDQLHVLVALTCRYDLVTSLDRQQEANAMSIVSRPGSWKPSSHASFCLTELGTMTRTIQEAMCGRFHSFC
jgi:hypothetical protein